MGTLIDSSVLIEAERGRLELQAILAREGDDSVAIAAITASELLHGVHRLKKATSRARAETFIERLLGLLPVIPFDLVVARAHARLGAELITKGQAVGAHDLIIAATAVALGLDIATHDLRSFPRIPGLIVRRW